MADPECAPPSGQPPFCLSGVITSPEHKVALVNRPGQPLLSNLLEGQVLDDWKVERIGPGFVEMSNQDRTVRLSVSESSGEPAAAAAAAPKPPPRFRPNPIRRPNQG
jgi:hypothetical protein